MYNDQMDNKPIKPVKHGGCFYLRIPKPYGKNYDKETKFGYSIKKDNLTFFPVKIPVKVEGEEKEQVDISGLENLDLQEFEDQDNDE